MNKQHHLFVQGIMCKKRLNKEEFIELYTFCLRQNNAFREGNNRLEEIKTFVNTIRNALKDLDFDIRKVTDELSGETFYVWLVTREREWNKDNAFYSPNQAEFFKKLLEEIVTGDEGCVTSTAALNLTNELEHSAMSKQEAEQCLKMFEAHGWLVMARGKIYLGVSALAEFEQYIKENFQDSVHTCDQCQQMVVYGTHCGNCDNRFHRHCLKRYFSTVKRHECPKCQSHLSAN